MQVEQAKRAAGSALGFFRALEIEPDATDLRVEEIEQSEVGDEWRITISYARPQPPYAAEARLAKMMGTDLYGSAPPMERDFRTLVLSGDDFEVKKVGPRD